MEGRTSKEPLRRDNIKTNIGLVKYAEKALNEGWGYVWGTFGQVLTEKLFQTKLNQYPKGVGNYRTFIRNNWLGKRTADCIGLIKSYMWESNGVIRYDSKTDVNANMMYDRAKKKGAIKTIPEVPGLAVWRKGHIGVYVGDGWVIEAQGTQLGVKKTRLSNRNFTHWLEIPYISYTKNVPEEEEDLKIEKVKVNIHNIEKEIDSILQEGVHYIPIRTLEDFGYDVKWDNKNKVVGVDYRGK